MGTERQRADRDKPAAITWPPALDGMRRLDPRRARSAVDRRSLGRMSSGNRRGPKASGRSGTMLRLMLIALLGMFGIFGLGCGADTGGALVNIRFEIEADWQHADGVGRFTTGTGYRVDLDQAVIVARRVLCFAPLPRTARRTWISVARAHGGFDPFSGRTVSVEWSGPASLDLLRAEPVVSEDLVVESGPIESCSMEFGDLDGEPGVQAIVAGVATKGDSKLPFTGALTLSMSALQMRADDIPAAADLQEGGLLTLRIDLASMLAEADFGRLSSGDGQPAVIDDTSQAHTAWSFGARSNRSYSTQWSSP